jgi:hypothetical protein
MVHRTWEFQHLPLENMEFYQLGYALTNKKYVSRRLKTKLQQKLN